MNRRNIMTIGISIVVILAVTGISLNSASFIRKNNWKYSYGEGYIGDWIEFDGSTFEIKTTRIYHNKIEVGRIVFCMGGTLVIKNNSGKLGYYKNKSN